MALTYSDVKRRVVGDQQVITGTLTFDSSYPTGGEAVSLAAIGLTRLDELIVRPAEGYVPEWDRSRTAPKVLLYYSDNNTASDGVMIQLPDTTDASALDTMRFEARGA